MYFRILKPVSIWVAVLGGSALLFAAVIVDAHQVERVQGEAVASVSTVDYFSGTAHYAVPANYYPEITLYSEKRKYSALGMMLFLPDFSPAAEHPAEMKRVGWHDQMTLLFEHGPRMGDPDAQIAWMTNSSRGVQTLSEPTANGCDLYRTPLMVPGDVYVCPEDGSKLVLSCKPKADVPFPSCTVFENVSPDLSLIYHYSAKYAADAVSIDRRIRALIASFLTSQTSSAR